MPQKKISQLTSVSSDVVNSSDTLEICTLNSNRAKASRKISLRDIGKQSFPNLVFLIIIKLLNKKSKKQKKIISLIK